MKIIIVDDQLDIAEAVELMINNIGENDTEIFVKPEVALKRLENKDYDMVICDYGLGGDITGFHILRQAECKKKALMSGSDSQEILALSRGYHFFLKPIMYSDIEEWLSPKYD